MNFWTRFNEKIKAPPVIRIKDALLEDAGVELWIQREDQLHSRLSGNKWRKLKYNILSALKTQKSTLISFGGAYSNHIAALAEAGNIFGLSTIGIIRGEEDLFNPTLKKAAALGMKLFYVSRSAYRDKSQLINDLRLDLTDAMIIPEGGTNKRAIKGSAEIIQTSTVSGKINYWCVACGTGGTAAGMITALRDGEQLIGFPVLKGNWMEQVIRDWLALVADDSPERIVGLKGPANKNNWSLCTEYHFGGYAEFDQELIKFINIFKKQHGVPLDPIYTGKMLFGLFDKIEQGFFERGSRIVAIHTGGLQGLMGFKQRYGGLLE